MSKAAITKKYSLSANGILDINDNGIGLENTDTGEWLDLRDLLSDFSNKSVKLSIAYDEEYGSDDE